MLVAALTALRQVLLTPGTFFEERSPAETIPIVAGIVLLHTIALVVSIYLLIWIVAGIFEGTVMVDNPDRPPETMCETLGEDSDSPIAERCEEEPAEIERDPAALLRETMTRYVGFAILAPFVMWLLGGITLYVAGRVAAGTPSFVGSLGLAGWAAVPEFFRLAVALVAIRSALSDATISDPADAIEVVQSAFAPIDLILTAATLLTVLWQWYILTGGLQHEADLSRSIAGIAVAVPLAIWLGISL